MIVVANQPMIEANCWQSERQCLSAMVEKCMLLLKTRVRKRVVVAFSLDALVAGVDTAGAGVAAVVVACLDHSCRSEKMILEMGHHNPFHFWIATILAHSLCLEGRMIALTLHQFGPYSLVMDVAHILDHD